MSAKRHGKQLVLPLDRGVLGLHMGMTGRLVILEPDDEPLRYTRYTFTLNDGGASNLTTSGVGPAPFWWIPRTS